MIENLVPKYINSFCMTNNKREVFAFFSVLRTLFVTPIDCAYFLELCDKHQVTIAGGFCLGIFSNTEVNDIDCFFLDKDTLTNFIIDFTGEKSVIGQSFNITKQIDSINATTLVLEHKVNGKRVTVQCIHKVYGMPREILDSFDYTILQIGFSFADKQFVYNENTLDDIYKRRLVFVDYKERRDTSTAYIKNIVNFRTLTAWFRKSKYERRGFLMSSIDNLALSFSAFQVVREHVVAYLTANHLHHGVHPIGFQVDTIEGLFYFFMTDNFKEAKVLLDKSNFRKLMFSQLHNALRGIKQKDILTGKPKTLECFVQDMRFNQASIVSGFLGFFDNNFQIDSSGDSLISENRTFLRDTIQDPIFMNFLKEEVGKAFYKYFYSMPDDLLLNFTSADDETNRVILLTLMSSYYHLNNELTDIYTKAILRILFNPKLNDQFNLSEEHKLFSKNYFSNPAWRVENNTFNKEN